MGFEKEGKTQWMESKTAQTGSWHCRGSEGLTRLVEFSWGCFVVAIASSLHDVTGKKSKPPYYSYTGSK